MLRRRPPGEAGRYDPLQGGRRHRRLPLLRAVWRGELPPAGEDTVEYYIEAKTAGGETLRWPVTAPELNQTVVVMP